MIKKLSAFITSKKALCIATLMTLFALLEYFTLAHYDHSRHGLGHSFFLQILIVPLLFCSGRLVATILLPLFAISLIIFAVIAAQVDPLTSVNLDAIISTSWPEATSVLSDHLYLVLGITLLSVIIVLCLAQCAWRFAAFHLKVFTPLFALTILAGGIIFHNVEKRVRAIEYGTPKSAHAAIVEKAAPYILFTEAPGVVGSLPYILYREITPLEKSKPHTLSDLTVGGLKGPHIKNIIVVVGETALADHHNYHGYRAFETTPLMSTRQHKGKLCPIQGGHSIAPITRLAVPAMLSFMSPDQPTKLYSEKNLVELAKDAGYETYWIDDQNGEVFNSQTYDYIGKYSDHFDYNNPKNNLNWRDQTVLPFVSKAFEKPSERRFIVVHITGSHESYSDKYDKEDKAALPTASDYDRSLHKTDRILEKIMEIADHSTEDYILLYGSDHGEDLKRQYHGLLYGDEAQYRIPLFLSWSGKLGRPWCGLAQKYRSDEGDFSQEMEKFLLLGMMGYQLNMTEVEKVRKTDHVMQVDFNIYKWRHETSDQRLHAVPVKHVGPI